VKSLAKETDIFDAVQYVRLTAMSLVSSFFGNTVYIAIVLVCFWRHAGYGMNAYQMAPVCYEIAPCINGST